MPFMRTAPHGGGVSTKVEQTGRNINSLGPAVMPVADPVAEIILKIEPARLDRAEPPSARTANLSTAPGKRGRERPADSPNLDGLRAVAGR
jgi:hypothetical protein